MNPAGGPTTGYPAPSGVRHYPERRGYHPFPSGTVVRGVYDVEGDSCVGRATVVCAWWEELPGAPWVRASVACVRLQFDGNGTPDAYEGPARLVVQARAE